MKANDPSSAATTTPGKTLQETLQLCTDECGKSVCKVLARSLFSGAAEQK
jgi:hypothetical protein